VLLNGRVFDRTALDSMLTAVEVAARPDAQTKLLAASISGDTALIVQALNEGARIDSLDPQRNRRALNYAAINNRGAAVRLLITRGATLNLANRTGFTPLHHAAEAGANDALAILIAAGADINIASSQGRRPLDSAKVHGDQAVIQLLEAAAKKP
jgi:ankyrin repeat protein